MWIPVPYIDRFGKFTIHTLGEWRTKPETWFASVVSTIDSRLWSLYKSSNKKWRCAKTSDRNLITRISVVYAYYHNPYFMDRIIPNLLKGRFGVLRSLLKSVCKRSGETFWFVYSQISLQISWLNFRSKWIRDKPAEVDSLIQKTPVCVKRRKGPTYMEFNPFHRVLDYSRILWLELTKDGKYDRRA